MKYIILVFFSLAFFLSLKAQQEPQFSQYFTNQLVFNPAAAGAEQNTNIAFNFRNQYADDGYRNQYVSEYYSPRILSLSGDHYFDKIKTALGMSAVYENIGTFKTVAIRVAAAYRIKVGQKSFFQLGLDAGIKYVDIDRSNQSTAYGPLGKLKEAGPLLSAGLLFHSKRFTTSLSSTQLAQHTYESGLIRYYEDIHFYLYFQYRQPLGINFSLRPTALLKISGCCGQVDLNLLAYYQQRAFIGGGYHQKSDFYPVNEISLLAGIKIWKIWLQYSYDFTFSENEPRNNSHEAMVRYIIPIAEDYYTKP